jgi:hypothetical protein
VESGAQVSMAQILRLRQKNKNKRIGGVEFRASGHIARDEDGAIIHQSPEEGGSLSTDGDGTGAGTRVIRKFAPQTGTVGDVNKHM